jgi:hypothetical protein
MSALALPAIASFNSELFLGGPTSPPSYTLQARIGNIKFGGIAIDIVDVSNQTSTAHRKLATLLNPGDMTFDLYWEPASTQDETLFDLIIAAPPVLQQWKVVLAAGTDGTALLFNGYLSKFPIDASIGKALMASGCTIAIDGSITPVFGAGPT